MMNMFIVLVFYQIILNIYPITYSLITLIVLLSRVFPVHDFIIPIS